MIFLNKPINILIKKIKNKYLNIKKKEKKVYYNHFQFNFDIKLYD
jgi:hypothetical protein